MKYKLTENKTPDKSTAKLRNRYFFTKSGTFCSKLQVHVDDMRLHHIKETTLYLAQREIGSEYMFCKYIGEAGLKYECGRWCRSYRPKNKKSGACIHLGCVYEQTDREFTLTISESEFINE